MKISRNIENSCENWIQHENPFQHIVIYKSSKADDTPKIDVKWGYGIKTPLKNVVTKNYENQPAH